MFQGENDNKFRKGNPKPVVQLLGDSWTVT